MNSAEASAIASFATPGIREVSATRPFHWLMLGWKDFMSASIPSALHGLLLAVTGLLIFRLAWGQPHLLAGSVSGFLLVSPILATGLYELSRRLERGEPATLAAVVGAWRSGVRPLVWLGLLLMLAGTAWVLISLVMIALTAPASVSSIEGFLRQVVLSRDSHLFEAWVALGGFVASLVFAVSVISAPMLLDRDTDLLTAIQTSVRSVAGNPVPMAVWATVIMMLTLLGMATMMMGLVLVVPVLGHASWHAYRDVVDASALPQRR